MLTWTVGKVGLARGVHSASMGQGELRIYGFASNNGGRWFNWWITTDGMDFMGEAEDRIEGGAKTLSEAKGQVYLEMEKLVMGYAASLGLMVTEAP